MAFWGGRNIWQWSGLPSDMLRVTPGDAWETTSSVRDYMQEEHFICYIISLGFIALSL